LLFLSRLSWGHYGRYGHGCFLHIGIDCKYGSWNGKDSAALGFAFLHFTSRLAEEMTSSK
jgi:hypothetical protein